MIVCFQLNDPDDFQAKLFFERFKQKCDEPFNLFKSPFNKKRLWWNLDGHGVFNLEISWPPLHLMGLLGIAAAWFFGLAWGWFIIPVIMSSLSLFWIPGFYILMFRLGLKKAGYKGKVRMMSPAKMLEVIVWDR